MSSRLRVRQTLLPRAIQAASTLMDPALAAQFLATLLLLEGDPHQAVTALGMSQAIRGAFDHGDASLVDTLVTRLGRTEYDSVYRQGSDISRQEAINRLTDCG